MVASEKWPAGRPASSAEYAQLGASDVGAEVDGEAATLAERRFGTVLQRSGTC